MTRSSSRDDYGAEAGTYEVSRTVRAAVYEQTSTMTDANSMEYEVKTYLLLTRARDFAMTDRFLHNGMVLEPTSILTAGMTRIMAQVNTDAQ